MCDALSVDANATLWLMKLSSRPLLLPLGKAIRDRREELGISQERLAEEAGFDRTYISMLERGTRNPSFLNLIKIASGLKTSVSKITVSYDQG
jgi:transcriptional regulator with XRE-family HTH domain